MVVYITLNHDAAVNLYKQHIQHSCCATVSPCQALCLQCMPFILCDAELTGLFGCVCVPSPHVHVCWVAPAGITKVGFPEYVAASWAGMLPGTFAYVYLGSLGKVAADAADTGAAGGFDGVKLALYGEAAAATLVHAASVYTLPFGIRCGSTSGVSWSSFA